MRAERGARGVHRVEAVPKSGWGQTHWRHLIDHAPSRAIEGHPFFNKVQSILKKAKARIDASTAPERLA